MDKQNRKQLQRILSDKDWPAVEVALEKYLKDNFLQGSAKKDNEFETMWYLAFMEGGKYYLQRFFNQLEDEARQAE